MTAPSINVSQELLDEILSPYKPDCRYLKRASASVSEDNLSAEGEFEIPEPFYIAATGHFNAVEFNICYNQITYVLLGQSVVLGRLPELQMNNLETYRRRQLADVLIVRFESNFRRPIKTGLIRANLSFDSVRVRKRAVLIDTSISFSSDDGGSADGKVLLGIIDSEKMENDR